MLQWRVWVEWGAPSPLIARPAARPLLVSINLGRPTIGGHRTERAG